MTALGWYYTDTVFWTIAFRAFSGIGSALIFSLSQAYVGDLAPEGFEGRYMGTGPEAGLMMPSLEALAGVYGLPYLRIDDAATLGADLDRAMALPRPCIIDVHLLKDETLAPKCAAISRPDGSIASMPQEDMSPLLSLAELQREMLVPLLPASLEAVRASPAAR